MRSLETVVGSRPRGFESLPAASSGPEAAWLSQNRLYTIIRRFPAASAGGGRHLHGWYAVGGTSASSPQWAGIAAIADQVAGRDLGNINPALYQVADNAAKYAADFFDVTANCNQFDPSIPGYCASPGWDAVTGLGTPNAANLIPDLIAATP